MLCQTPLYVALRACGVQDPGPLQLCCLANARLPVSRSPCAVWQPWLQLIGTASRSEIGVLPHTAAERQPQAPGGCVLSLKACMACVHTSK